MSPFFYVLKNRQRGGASWWRICYQWGLPRLVFTVAITKKKWLRGKKKKKKKEEKKKENSSNLVVVLTKTTVAETEEEAEVNEWSKHVEGP